MKKFFENKSVGFFVTLGSIALTLVTAIVYLACYFNTKEFNTVSVILLFVAPVVSGALVCLKQERLATVVLWFLNFLAFLFFAYGIYRYVFDVIIGIDYDHFEPEFFVCTIFYVLSVGVSTSTVFLSQTKKGENE